MRAVPVCADTMVSKEEFLNAALRGDEAAVRRMLAADPRLLNAKDEVSILQPLPCVHSLSCAVSQLSKFRDLKFIPIISTEIRLIRNASLLRHAVTCLMRYMPICPAADDDDDDM